MSSYEHVILDIRPPVASITIHRPPMNVLHIPAITEMISALRELQNRRDVFLIVFRGDGEKAFSAGVDIKDHTLDKVEAMLQSFHDVFRMLHNSRWITVASVHGYCLGGGMELALFCDWVIAEENAIFAQPEIKVGCYPPVAAAMLPKWIGYKKALEIAALGENMTADQLFKIGLISKLAAPGQVEAVTHELVSKLSAMSFSVLQLTKKAVMAGSEASTFEESLKKAESIYIDELTKTKDLSEGITAFMEKRKPVWSNA